MPGKQLIVIGEVVKPHGIRGELCVDNHADSPLLYAPGRELTLRTPAGRDRIVRVAGARPHQGRMLFTLEGVADRDAAEALRGVRLYVPRAALPATREDEYYHADLIGLPVETREGAPLGSVLAVHNFGAGDILELRAADGRELLLPFSDAAVPTVDLAAGRIVADPPLGLLDDGAQAEIKAGGAVGRGGGRRRRRRPRARGAGGGAAGL